MFHQLCLEIKSWGHPCSGLLLAVYGPGLGPDGPGCPGKHQTNPVLSAEQHLFPQLCPEINSWGRSCSPTTPGYLSTALDLAQMVLENRENLGPTQFYMLNIFGFNNFPQKSSPVVILALGLLLSVYGPGPGPDGPGGSEVP